ncbi:hypothetical protein [Roseibacillus persicicus]|uniref:hypothetical protein n=1 Tax=Roseibacillus persicicus TaxID=454148 RepID=UPI00280F8F8A|nr:hypothetical protein [Roseibacillus persicicus]MDQ8190880.1 hypothetical protein [Roseibacillus persicicus]
MVSILPLLIYLIIPVVMLIAGILAHRGKAFWATWMMLIGSILVVIGLAGMIASMAMIYGNLGSTAPMARGTGSSMRIVLMAIAGLGSLFGSLAYAAGLIGLCARWGATARRAAELEELTQSLITERSQNQN